MAQNTSNLLAKKSGDNLAASTDPRVHVLKPGIICATESRAKKRNRFSIVVDATDGFVPLWAENLVLRWKFDATSLAVYEQPEAIKETIRGLLSRAITAWDFAVPIRFDENPDNADFQITVEEHDSCNPQGCTLAQAFFPDAGRHHLFVFPRMFEQDEQEQVDTMAHEIGHVFGLRHFFAPKSEAEWPAEIFGNHKPFSIMNYGAMSALTDEDRRDLRKLYEGAWSGKLKDVNRTPIKLVTPAHYLHA